MRYSQRLLFLGMLLTLVVAVPGHLHGRTQDPHHPDQGFAPDAAATPEQHQRIMSQNMMGMMSEMKTADAKLDELVQTMKAAKGAGKTDAIAAVVTALVEEHRSMHSSMATMMMMMKMMKTIDMTNTTGASGRTEHDHSKP